MPLNLNTVMILLAIGLVAGLLSGLVGIGGGIIIVPVLVYLGFTQHAAQGTVLAMFLIPIGILGVMQYHQAGHVSIKTALIIATTFIIGSYFGSKLAISVNQEVLRKIFGGVLLLLALKMLFGK